jgi:hypothetical protein
MPSDRAAAAPDGQVIYHASNPNEKDINGNPIDGQKLLDALMDLAEQLKKKSRGIDTGKYLKADEVPDPARGEEAAVTATAEVAYDPKTGR